MYAREKNKNRLPKNMVTSKRHVKRHRLFKKKCSLLLTLSTLRVCRRGFESHCISANSLNIYRISRDFIYISLTCKLTPVVPWLSYSPLDPRFAGSNLAGVDGFFHSVKILSMTSSGREVKPLVPCRRFTASKRTSNQN